MKKILIVEDNNKHMNALCKMLSCIDNIQIFKAYNMADACYMLSLNDFDLFLVDIILDIDNKGDISGLNLVNYIREIKRYQFTPIIFITSLEDPMLYAYRDLHCYQYIEKPFDNEYVLQTVKSALEYPGEKNKKEFVYFRIEGVIYSVKLDDITYITISKKTAMVFVQNDCIKANYYSIPRLMKILNSDEFIQCNRNTIINKRYLDYIDIPNKYLRLKGVEKIFEIGMTMKSKFAQLEGTQ